MHRPPRIFTRSAAAIACALAILAPAAANAGGIVLIQDDKAISGIVNWTADGKIAVAPPGKTTQIYDLKDVRTLVIDANPAAANQLDVIAWQKKELGRDRPLGASIVGDTHITIRDNLSGIRFGQKNGDSCSFVYQKLEGDCELVARILPKDESPRTKAGLMIREGLELDSPMVVLLRGGEGGPSRLVSVFGGRETRGTNSEQYAESTAPVFGACWLKIIRTADNFTAYDSVDGKNWNEIGTHRIPFDVQKPIYAGVCAASYGREGLVGFDKVAMTTPMQSAASAPLKRPNSYLLTRDGSVLAADLLSVVDGTLMFRRAGESRSIPLRDAVRFQLRPLARSAEEKLDQCPPGVMITDGDFVEGEIQAIDDAKIRVSSIAFGITNVDRNKADAVIFRETPPGPASRAATRPAEGASGMIGGGTGGSRGGLGGGSGEGSGGGVEVRLQDNSVLQATTITVEKDRIIIEGSQAGTLRIPPKDIILFDRKK